MVKRWKRSLMIGESFILGMSKLWFALRVDSSTKIVEKNVVSPASGVRVSTILFGWMHVRAGRLAPTEAMCLVAVHQTPGLEMVPGSKTTEGWIQRLGFCVSAIASNPGSIRNC